ncbi:MAG: alpha/beta hydrolase [Nocardioides sp.]
MSRPTRTPLAALAGALTLLAAGLATLPASPGAAATTGSGAQVVTRAVHVDVDNTNGTHVACTADGRSYRLRGELVGPRREVLGASVDRVNVLVHDTTTGSWFWQLPGHPAYDYAEKLAAHGETSLVLDRLGYDSSPLKDGNATCLGAQADMVHQVVQHLRSGSYHFTGSSRGVPAAEHVVLQGHSVGAAIAQVEAATFDDVDGLVLMSWSDSGATQAAVDGVQRQSQRCLQGADYAAFATSGRQFRRLAFATAPAGVQHTAARLRNQDPCGDVLSLGSVYSVSNLLTHQIEAPTLLLYGGRDKLNDPSSASRQQGSYKAGTPVARTTFAGAGNMLPLEKAAPQVRARVIRWLAALR